MSTSSGPARALARWIAAVCCLIGAAVGCGGGPQSGRFCADSACPTGQQCVGCSGPENCAPVRCGPTLPCADPTEICDPYVHECYPMSGACRTSADCPRFQAEAGEAFALSCEEGFCRLRVNARVPGTKDIPPVAVQSPENGASLPMGTEPAFRWTPLDTGAILLVLSGLPAKLDDLPRLAVWGYAAPAGQGAAEWRDGVSISNGRWQESSAMLPVGRPLYLLVQGIQGGKLRSASDLVSFIIGGSYPGRGSPCSWTSTAPGSCRTPSSPQACILDPERHDNTGACVVLCASHRDCIPYGLQCNPPKVLPYLGCPVTLLPRHCQ